MAFDEINKSINSVGGRWLKLFEKAHGVLEYVVLDAEVKDRTDTDGNVVLSKKTGKVRKVWVITFQTDLRDPEDPEDDGKRKFSANESCQFAITDAVKESGKPFATGGTLKLGVLKDASGTAQAEYQARWTPADPAASVNEAVQKAEDEPPF